ncbi:HipA domain-containing protein [Planococcus lenghuensis]|uniref:HipA-like C-terminal domain-containing protein n=1 Tax=Planococcus lenghuensis TaxID=2213202 RepID=A0A1Q2L108_9BACL|nr:HipA domain-containing protein [Planococcus lenghuensis]AQQ54111.1 hypothetical protein B0X71_14025 [Planococcus lenghuensis]
MDVSDWPITGYGENSTLEKFELLSPEGVPYVIKFPREFDQKRTNWEDLNEIIAAKIASMLGLKAVDAEIAYYGDRRACLMKHFAFQFGADDRETVAALLIGQFGEEYKDISDSSLSNLQRLEEFLSLFNQFNYYPIVKEYFVHMNFFDILIGNQDRHGHNWQLLFREGEPSPSPLYDNGASLGWQLPDEKLLEYLSSPEKMHKLYKKTLLKVGLDNRETPKIKASSVIEYLITSYPSETKAFYEKLLSFDMEAFEVYCQAVPLISETRKKFLTHFIDYRKEQLLRKMEGGN